MKNQVKMAKITLSEYENECTPFCTIYVVLFSIIFAINIGIGTSFIYYKYMDHDKKKQLLKKVLSFKQQFTEDINGKYEANKH